MKIIFEFDVEIDGVLDENKAKEIFFEMFSPEKPILLSEDYTDDENEDWALVINGWEIKD